MHPSEPIASFPLADFGISQDATSRVGAFTRMLQSLPGISALLLRVADVSVPVRTASSCSNCGIEFSAVATLFNRADNRIGVGAASVLLSYISDSLASFMDGDTTFVSHPVVSRNVPSLLDAMVVPRFTSLRVRR